MRDFKEYKEIIEKKLVDYLPDIDLQSKSLFEGMEYSLKAGGKRLRPGLLLAACEFAGGDYKDALPYALAIEYIHTYSLIHDDLPSMDNDDLRRGKPTNHKVFGEASAILSGDGLLNSAYEVMLRDFTLHKDKPEELSLRINGAYAIAKAAGIQGMVAGQVADMENQGKEPKEDALIFIHENKTMKMIQGAIVAGAYLGGANEDMIKNLSSYGYHIGMAFQIADDILDVMGSSEELGKETGSDLELDKLTYVEYYGLEKSKELLHKHTVEANASLDKYGDEGDFFRNLALELEKRTY